MAKFEDSRFFVGHFLDVLLETSHFCQPHSRLLEATHCFVSHFESSLFLSAVLETSRRFGQPFLELGNI